MKKLLVTIPILFGVLIGGNLLSINVHALSNASLEAVNTSGGKLIAPQNTQCRKIDFTNDVKRTDIDSRTTFVGDGTDPNGDFRGASGKYNIYDLCIGSFPRFPSTSVEGGVKPFYYAKYYFLPDPMPVYNIEQDKKVVNGTTIVGLDQKFTMNISLENKTKPSDPNLFVLYPYDKTHVSASPTPNASIKGPYQIGYNSFYHNTYRSRYFASQALFDFYVLEPKKGSRFYNPVENQNYQDKTILFAGAVVYDLPDNCYRDDYLDYTDSCRDIEFYFPKAATDTDTAPKEGTGKGKWYWDQAQVKNTVSVDESSTNVISKDGQHYMNPGEHYLVMNVTENTQLRYQKDEGAEFQTLPNKTNNQGAGSNSAATNGVVYFPRLDMGGGVNPHFTTYNLTNIGNDSVKLTSGFYYYQPTANENFINYCDSDTNSWGSVNNANRGTTGDQLSRTNQVDKSCYHNEGKDFHFWKYYWSNTDWYAANPRFPSF